MLLLCVYLIVGLVASIGLIFRCSFGGVFFVDVGYLLFGRFYVGV